MDSWALTLHYSLTSSVEQLKVFVCTIQCAWSERHFLIAVRNTSAYMHTVFSAEDSDYEVGSHTLTLTPDTSEACVAVFVMDDKAVERSEDLMISLSQLEGEHRVQIPKAPAIVSIQDNDGQPH